MSGGIPTFTNWLMQNLHQMMPGTPANQNQGPQQMQMAASAPERPPPATPDPYGQAVQQALQKYPFLGRLGAPIKLVSGTGPYGSESFLPEADDNPAPGHFTVQLRSAESKANPQLWPVSLASEGLDYMARKDPQYKQMAESFRASMTPAQLAHSQWRYEKDKKANPEDAAPDFNTFLKQAEIQEYARGYLFPEAAPGWTGPQGEGKYTPAQTQMLDKFKQYLQSPTPPANK